MSEKEGQHPATKPKKRRRIFIGAALFGFVSLAASVFLADTQPALEISYEGRTTNSSGEAVWMFKTENKSGRTLLVHNSILTETTNGWAGSADFISAPWRIVDAGDHHIVPIQPASEGSFTDTRHWRYCARHVSESSQIEDFLYVLISKLGVPRKPLVERQSAAITIMGPIIDPANLPPESPSTETPLR